MRLASLPDNEEERLEVLYELGILDTLEEQTYDDLTFLAAQICGAPISIITFVDRDRQWFKSIYGLNAKETPREGGFCSSAIFDDNLTIIEDATKDERFHHHPFVTCEPYIKFYAGAPLIFSDNIRLGSICVIDQTARSITPDQEKALESLARQVVSLLELRLSVKELESSKEDADRANQAKSEFLSSMSHELRTPLNAVLGFGQLLDIKFSETSDIEAQENIKDILGAGHHLLNLINEVLDLSRIEAGSLGLSPESISLHQAITECISQIDIGLTRERNISLINQVSDQDIEIMADPMRFKQVIINLLSNAAKYNKEGGTVTIKAEHLDNERLRITITDTGIGIAAADINKLFDPFERLSAKNGSIEGTGIGLTVTKQLVEAMDGTLGVESRVDQGSTFIVDLPLNTGIGRSVVSD